GADQHQGLARLESVEDGATFVPGDDLLVSADELGLDPEIPEGLGGLLGDLDDRREDQGLPSLTVVDIRLRDVRGRVGFQEESSGVAFGVVALLNTKGTEVRLDLDLLAGDVAEPARVDHLPDVL